jgi:predicted transposase/invertase (TIGR01784 family)
MSYKVTPSVYVVFRKLFGAKENKDLLISLINSIVSQEDQVSDVSLLNPKEDSSVLDINARSADGRRYSITLQINDKGLEDYDEGALYNWRKLYYTKRSERGAKYLKSSKIIWIHILNPIRIPSVEAYHNIFQLREKMGSSNPFNDIELHTIELDKFKKVEPEMQFYRVVERKCLQKIKTPLDRWMALLTDNDLLRELKDTKIKKAMGVLKTMHLNAQEDEDYEDRLKWLRMVRSSMKKIQEVKRVQGLFDHGLSKQEISTLTGIAAVEIDRMAAHYNMTPTT